MKLLHKDYTFIDTAGKVEVELKRRTNRDLLTSFLKFLYHLFLFFLTS